MSKRRTKNKDKSVYWILFGGIGLVILGAFSIIMPFLITDNVVRALTVAGLGIFISLRVVGLWTRRM